MQSAGDHQELSVISNTLTDHQAIDCADAQCQIHPLVEARCFLWHLCKM